MTTGPLSFLLISCAAFSAAVLSLNRSLSKTTTFFYLLMLGSSIVAPLLYILATLIYFSSKTKVFGWDICASIVVLVFGITWRNILLKKNRQKNIVGIIPVRVLFLEIRNNWIFLFFALVITAAVTFTCWLAGTYEANVGRVLPISQQQNDPSTPTKELNATSENDVRAKWGTTGDFFGGMLNPAFSLIGLLLLLATLNQNQKELRLSRTELKLSSNALNAQAATAEKQRFEDTFFALLEQLDRCLERVERQPGREAQSLAKNLKEELIGGTTMRIFDEPDNNLRNAKSLLLKRDPAINQLFRLLYQILKLICERAPGSTLGDGFNIENLQKSGSSVSEKFYSNLVRALLSEDIYYLLAINASSENDLEFRAYTLLVERYSMLEHMSLIVQPRVTNITLLIDIVKHYDRSAFGSNRSLKGFTERHMCFDNAV